MLRVLSDLLGHPAEHFVPDLSKLLLDHISPELLKVLAMLDPLMLPELHKCQHVDQLSLALDEVDSISLGLSSEAGLL